MAVDPTREPQLRIRLIGMHADAPWTGTVKVRLIGWDLSKHPAKRIEHTARQQPATDGLAEFTLPAWATDPWCAIEVKASDPYYRQVATQRFDTLRLDTELQIEVQPMARAAGRVIDRDGRAVHAAIRVYRQDDERPIRIPTAATTTAVDGKWRLKIPAGVSLLLTIVPILRNHELPSALREVVTIGHGELTLARPDLLPSSTQLVGRIGETTDIATSPPALAATVTGVARWSDGESIAGAQVRIRPRRGQQLDVSDDLQLHIQVDGALAPATSTWTATDGRFTLPAIPGTSVEVEFADLHLPPTVTVAAAPGAVTFDLPRPVELQVMCDGELVEGASIEVDGAPDPTCLRWGARLSPTHPMRVRAVHGARHSAWRSIGPLDAGRCIELELASRPPAAHSR